MPRHERVAPLALEVAATIGVTVVYSPNPREVLEVPIRLAVGATVDNALQLSGLPAKFPQIADADVAVGIWGDKAQPGQTLRDKDRVEIYRTLKVDPKEARRARFAQQGAKTAGLFAKRRSGAKAGY